MTMTFEQYFAKHCADIPFRSGQAVLALKSEGATVPFIARYRKERTGNLDEVQIRKVCTLEETYQEVIKRQAFLIKEIEGQGNLTPELRARIQKSYDLGELEEIYRPFKKKRKTKATIAREAGLEPLAEWLWKVGHGEIEDATTPEVKAKEFINNKFEIVTYEHALKGAQDILVERISNDPGLRDKVREDYLEHGKILSKPGKQYKAKSKFEMYAEHEEPVQNLLLEKNSHRYLAMRRGWQEGELVVTMTANDEDLAALFVRFACTREGSAVAEFLTKTARLALAGSVIPSVVNEVHRLLKESADDHAIAVFGANVKKVLLASPFGARCVIGVDPGLRTGCKIALIDKSGQFVSHTVVHIVGDAAKENAKKLFAEVSRQIRIDAIAVGNGTGGREAEAFLREIFKELELQIPVLMVNESGASVYSASDVAREEFPELDLTVRGAISIARRLQDPLAELVKIDPKSIGVGQYQHDVQQTRLKKSLHEVVESCVNLVGVDVNTASVPLLQYVSGIGPGVASKIVEYRSKHGLIQERDALLKIANFTTKVFEQAAGFLRIQNGVVALDATGIHPERYQALREMAQELGCKVTDLLGEGAKKLLPLREKWSQLIGEYTFDDIVKELEKPGRDPRDPYTVFSFREDIKEVKDLEVGMICPGIVTNVTNFGAFVDVGVHQDGLVHISELAHKFVDDPRKIVNAGDQVKVKVLAVDKEKNQISFTMKLTEKPKVISVRESGVDKDKSPRRNAPRANNQRDAAPRAARSGGTKENMPNRDRKPARTAPPSGKSAAQGRSTANRPTGGRPQSTPFNNPFAALLEIKGNTKR